MEQSSASHENAETQVVSAPITPISQRIINITDTIASRNNGATDAKEAIDSTRGTAGMISAVAASLQLLEESIDDS